MRGNLTFAVLKRCTVPASYQREEPMHLIVGVEGECAVRQVLEAYSLLNYERRNPDPHFGVPPRGLPSDEVGNLSLRESSP